MADQQPKGVLIIFQGDEFDADFAVRLYDALPDSTLYCTSEDASRYQPGYNLSYKLSIVIFQENLDCKECVGDELPDILFTSKQNIHNHQNFCPVYYNTNPAKVKKDVDCFDDRLNAKSFRERWPRWFAAVPELPNFPGWYFNEHGEVNESEFIHKIVEDVSRMFRGVPPLHMVSNWKEVPEVSPQSGVLPKQLPEGVLISVLNDEYGGHFAVRLNRALPNSTLYFSGAEAYEYKTGIHLSYELAIVVFDDKLSFPWSVDDQLPDFLSTSKLNIRNHQYLCPVYYNTNPAKVKEDADCFELRGRYGTYYNEEQWARWYAAVLELPNFPGWYFKHNGLDREDYEPGFIDMIVEDVSRMYRGYPPLHMASWDVVPEGSPSSQSVPDVSLPAVEVGQIAHVYLSRTTWTVVGLISGLCGLLCYALSPSFNPLIRSWKPFSVIVYVALCIAILAIIWFAYKTSRSTPESGNCLLLKEACTTFAVLIITPVYSFIYDKVVSGKPHMLSVISNVSFTIMSLSLHKLANLGYEIGVTTFFFGCFTIQMLTINWMLIIVAIIFGFLLLAVRFLCHLQPGEREHIV